VVKLTKPKSIISKKIGSKNTRKGVARYKKLESFGQASADLVNRLFTPIDATNRFINLALHHIEEDSQSRQFLLESKSGIRKMAELLKELGSNVRKMEEEISEIAKSVE